MSKNKAKIILACILLFIVIASLIIIPLNGKDYFQIGKSNYDFHWAATAIKLGLDLEGGMYAEYIADLEGIEDPDGAINGAISNLSELLFSRGYTEAVVTKIGNNGIRVEVPAVQDTEQLMTLIGKPAKLEFKDEDGNVLIEGDKHLDRAVATTGQDMNNVISLSFNRAGTAAFAKATEDNLNKTIGIFIDGQEIMSPRVNTVISDGKAIIEGQYTREYAVEMATKINSGALGVQLTLLNSETISPTLGAEALRYGIIAGAIAILIVILLLMLIYKGLGICASLALIIYVQILIIALAVVPWVQLTLPGIAGIILSIGMAVDANIIIFERIKDEMATGKRTIFSAVNSGFKKAVIAILDANVTTIIGAIVMIIFGATAIKSFAITLLIGIILSMFTALIVTRFIIKVFLVLQPSVKFFGLMIADKIKKLNILDKLNFRDKELKLYEKNKIWFFVPVVIVFISLVFGTIYQFSFDNFANVGIDFQGGTVLNVEMRGADMNQANYDDNVKYISDIVEDNGLNVSIHQSSGNYAIIVRYTNIVNGVDYGIDERTTEMNAINHLIGEQIENKFREIYGDNIEIETTASLTGATASSRLIRTAFLSVGIAMLLILIYIIIRFDLFSGIGAIVALLHDVLIMLALTIVFRIQINSGLIAGIITIIAYSINNTIVIFDRVRDNVAPYITNNKKINAKEVINTSVAQTMTRSIYTTLTTVITVSMLAILGVPAIREFALPILFGLFAGFFSSVFIAPSIWGILQQMKINKQRKARSAQLASKASK